MPLSVPVPPPRSTLQSFYSDYVPRAWQALWAGGVAPESLRFACNLTIGGVVTSLDLRGAIAVASPTPATAPLLQMTCDAEAWKNATLDLWPRMLKTLSPRLEGLRSAFLAFAERRNLDTLWADLYRLPGTLRLDYVDDAGDTSTFELYVGSGQGPKAQVTAQESDLWPLVRGEAGLAKLLKTRFKMSGDTGWVLRLLAALTPPA